MALLKPGTEGVVEGVVREGRQHLRGGPVDESKDLLDGTECAGVSTHRDVPHSRCEACCF